jgi:Zn-dependent protease with chaperone function
MTKKNLLLFWTLLLLINCQLYAETSAAISSDNGDTSAFLTKKLLEQMDADYPVLAEDDEPYGVRLKQLTQTIRKYENLTLSYRIFHNEQITIIAFPDGNLRLSTGLMDLMNDDELFAIIGHAIGHLFYKDTEEAIQKAHAGKSADSQLKEILSAFTDFAYSKQREYAADEFSFTLCVDQGMDPYAMSSALEKLLKVSDKNARKLLTLHPDTKERVMKTRLLGDQYYNNQ